MLPLEMTPVTPRVPTGSQAESGLVHSGHVHTPPDHLTGATGGNKSSTLVRTDPEGENRGASMLRVQEDSEETDHPLPLLQEKEPSLEEKKIESLKFIQYSTAEIHEGLN